MQLLGAIAAFICVFFAVGMFTGHAPKVRFFSRPTARPDVTSRQIWLTQAGLDLSPNQYYAGLGMIGGVTFAIVSALTATPIVALAPAVISVVVPHAFFGRKRARNLSKTQSAWPDAIREVIASIESNASLHGALVQLAYKGPESLRLAFERFPSLASTSGVVPALESVRERLSDPTSDRVIEVLILAHERGGGIVTDILRDLATATTEDLQLQEEIESSQLEQRINARAVFVLPWAVLIMLVMGNKDFRGFYQSPAGFFVVMAGALVSCFGMFMIGRLSRDVPEPRVFGGSALPGRVMTAANVDEIEEDE